MLLRHLAAALICFASLLPAQNPKAKLPIPLYMPKNRPGKLIPGVVVILGFGWKVGGKEAANE